jgi:hypothetical protein
MNDMRKLIDAATPLFESHKKTPVAEAIDGPDYGHEGSADMALTQLHFIEYAAQEVRECLEAGTMMEEWYQNKLAKIHGDMEGLHSHMEGQKRRREMCGPDEIMPDDMADDAGLAMTEKKKDKSPGKIDKDEDPCWKGYKMVGTKKKNGKEVPNCVPGKKGK